MVNERLIKYMEYEVEHLHSALISMYELSKSTKIKKEFDAAISYAQLLREHLGKIIDIKEGRDV